MKTYNKILAGAAVLMGAMMFGSCQNSFDEPEVQIPVATMQANTTIADLKADMWQDDNNYAILCPMKDEETKTPYIIHGRVISSDAAGNIYKSLYIQDETGAITLSVNQSDMYVKYRYGQEVVIDVTGLYIGKYAGQEQLGWMGEYNGTPQVSFMPYEIFESHAERNGLPKEEVTTVKYGEAYPADGIYMIRCDIPTLNSMLSNPDKRREMMSQFIELNDVHFSGGGELTFATEDENVNRTLQDEAGNSIIVRTSGYSDFWNSLLPEGVGTVRGMLAFYATGDGSNPTWQIVLRSEADCVFDSKGTKNDPYTVAEAIALEGTGASGWVEGYIVGSLKGGVSSVSGSNDIIWSANAEMDNTIVIAPEADVKDITKCLLMPLQQGSDLRAKVNLLDNPSVYGKQIKVRGTFDSVLGTYGLTGNKGTSADFWLEGMQEDVQEPVEEGDGTEANPYNVAQIIKVATEAGATATDEVYFKGYITNIKELSVDYGNASFYIADKPNGGTTFYVYRIMDIGGKKFSDTNRLKVGDLVVIKSPVMLYSGNTPETVQNKGQLVSVNGNTDSSVVTPGDDDDNTPAVQPGSGAGTESDPYDVNHVIGTSSDETGVWVEGYVVGYIEGKTYDSGATFSAVASGSEYNNTNLILAPSATSDKTFQCIPVALPNKGDIRTSLGLKANPDILGKKVKLYGDITKYFGTRGLKEVSKYTIE